MAEADSATIRYHDESWEAESGVTIHRAIERVGIDPHSVLAIRGKKLVTHQTLLEPEDEIRLVDIVSGG
ncbi:MAG: MoaD/ThiS family protein [Chloroflexi bacterium]|nr:MoaD/ThiS family protein [Chloroflexota bacterium]